MTQNPLIDSSTQSSKTPGLKPALAAALASLEVQLDQELARYRRTRTGSRTLNQPRVGGYISSQPQQFTAITTTSSTTQQSVAEIKTNTSPASIPANPQDNAALTVKTQELDHLKRSSSLDAKTQTPPPPPNSSSIVPAVIKTTKSENLVQSDDTPKQPDDYLESSEALLRSLTEEQPETKKTTNSNDSLLSPLGIGSMLLLLVASLTLGYVVFNPKSLPQLNLSKLFNSDSSATGENTEEVGSNAQSQPQPEITSIPKYPNLAAKEFPELRDPNDVVGLKPKVQQTPIAVLNPVAPKNPVNPQVVLPKPIADQPTNAIATTPLPNLNSSLTPTAETSPRKSATPLKPNAEIKPAADGYYHIVTDNQGLSALASARQVVPDAYLSRNQKFIYLGAVKSKEEVERKLQELEAKGIKARIQQQ
ncbi:hypothetical protein [aff. Roholtiella sp. LEGE 12411]|uniref:hypothetical protein n=1 Tax=aff. Roholtiella sp. LEGE 12411 TaxID=1828822 RepID=UPI00187EF980|nr:hypothetical protein [aff. Roholtiella sp. LEGE 12411]MBE9035540.1 hypothetical protein [aff. Roholtiella sp. LEGE 12411]